MENIHTSDRIREKSYKPNQDHQQFIILRLTVVGQLKKKGGLWGLEPGYH